MGQKVTRRLAAILAADVAGYARLIEADEAGTIERLRAHRQALIQPAVAEHSGRIVKTTGDGLLAEFASAVDAVLCAAQLQSALGAREAALPEERRIRYRIGINLGDVVVEGDDVLGAGVNVAARLEALAAPGGICISGKVFEEVGGKIDLAFEDAGEQTVKNIARPVRVFSVAVGGGAAAVPQPEGNAAATLEFHGRPAVAVLPFDNLGGDPEQDYFSDGLAEDLIVALTQWRSFPVIARNSTFMYRDSTADMTRVACELCARYVLKGSVRKSGSRIRITATLVDGERGLHVWAHRYDRDLDDVFAVQDELVQRIAATIAPELGRAELKRSASKRPADLDAWDYYLRGTAALQEFTEAGNASARAMFERAIALDPDYSDAYTGLATSYSRDILLACAEDRAAAVGQAIAAARRAVALDPSSARAHQALSTVHIWRDEHELALGEGHIAVELNPSDAVSLHALGNKSDLAGDPAGIPRMVRAQQLNPQDPDRHSHLCFLARAYVNAGRYAEAAACARQAIDRRPDYPHAHYILAVAFGHLGQAVAARAALAACERLHPGFVESRADWHPYTDEARNRHLHDGLRKVGLGPGAR